MSQVGRKTSGGLVLGDVGVHRDRVPAEDDVVDIFGVASGYVCVPQWDCWEVFKQDRLGFLEDFCCFLRGAGRVSLTDLRIEFFVGVVAIIGTSAGAVQGGEEVAHAWVVSLPAGAECGVNGAVGYFIAQGLEVWVGVADSFNLQGVFDGVGCCINPGLVTAVRVVGNGKLRGRPLIHFISLCPKLLGLFRIVFQNLIARNVLGVASYNRRGEVMGWGAGAFEDGLGDFFTVDGV